MTKVEIAKKYFGHFVAGDVDKVLELWDADGLVNFDGPAPAAAFFEGSKDFVSTLTFKLKQAYLSEDGQSVILRFSYIMPTEDGAELEKQGLDIFEFTNENKIKELTVVHS